MASKLALAAGGQDVMELAGVLQRDHLHVAGRLVDRVDRRGAALVEGVREWQPVRLRLEAAETYNSRRELRSRLERGGDMLKRAEKLATSASWPLEKLGFACARVTWCAPTR